MKKISTVATSRDGIFKEPKLTIGLDLGDRSSHYCILDEAGNVILEHNLPTTPRAIAPPGSCRVLILATGRTTIRHLVYCQE